jgi:hypothetical protein
LSFSLFTVEEKLDSIAGCCMKNTLVNLLTSVILEQKLKKQAKQL